MTGTRTNSLPRAQPILPGAQWFREHREPRRQGHPAAALRLHWDLMRPPHAARRRRPVRGRQPERLGFELLLERRHRTSRSRPAVTAAGASVLGMPAGWNILAPTRTASRDAGAGQPSTRTTRCGASRNRCSTRSARARPTRRSPPSTRTSSRRRSGSSRIGATYDLDLGMFGLASWATATASTSTTSAASTKNAATIRQRSASCAIGTAPDGSPLYKRADRSDPDCLIAATVNDGGLRHAHG